MPETVRGMRAEIRRWVFDGGRDCHRLTKGQKNGCYGQVDRRDQESALTCWGSIGENQNLSPRQLLCVSANRRPHNRCRLGYRYSLGFPAERDTAEGRRRCRQRLFRCRRTIFSGFQSISGDVRGKNRAVDAGAEVRPLNTERFSSAKNVRYACSC